MNFVGSLVSTVSEFYKDLNPATLSGAIDIVVVERADGTLACSPFHVRFGKMQLLRPFEKSVEMKVNGSVVDIPMKLGEGGEAFFIKETNDEVPDAYQTSPLALTPQQLSSGHVPPLSGLDNLKLDPTALTRSSSDQQLNVGFVSPLDAKNFDFDSEQLKTAGSSRLGSNPGNLNVGHSVIREHPLSDSEVLIGSSSSNKDSIGVGYNASAQQSAIPAKMHMSDTEMDYLDLGGGEKLNAQNPQQFTQWKWGLLPSNESQQYSEAVPSSNVKIASKAKPEDRNLQSSQESQQAEKKHLEVRNTQVDKVDQLIQDLLSENERGGLEIQLSMCGKACADPEQFSSKLISFKDFKSNPLSILQDENLVIKVNDEYLTWHVLGPALVSKLFFKDHLDPEVLQTLALIPSLLTQKSELDASSSMATGIQTGGRLEQKSTATKSWWWSSTREKSPERRGQISDKSTIDATEQPPLSAPVGIKTQDIQLSDTATIKSLDASYRQGDGSAMNQTTTAMSAPAQSRPLSAPNLGEVIQAQQYKAKFFSKTLRLTSDQLRSLNLNYGANTVSFSVASSYSGIATCTARIFLWKYNVQIVVSDIDGTITKSDALGHLLPMLRMDWTHPGIANLYTSVKNNGYEILYLTSRAIGQADITRGYLKGIEQGSYQLPDGPVIMSPDRLIAALKREVIDRRPEEFKIAVLKDIKSLFKSRNPFYAGFGNRVTDAMSYRAVDIPTYRIYSINSQGEIKMDFFVGYTSSYVKLRDLVDHIFPPIRSKIQSMSKSASLDVLPGTPKSNRSARSKRLAGRQGSNASARKPSSIRTDATSLRPIQDYDIFGEESDEADRPSDDGETEYEAGDQESSGQSVDEDDLHSSQDQANEALEDSDSLEAIEDGYDDFVYWKTPLLNAVELPAEVVNASKSKIHDGGPNARTRKESTLIYTNPLKKYSEYSSSSSSEDGEEGDDDYDDEVYDEQYEGEDEDEASSQTGYAAKGIDK
ncbi:hypothetical protein MIR68_005629 [Amoeboaphelidium protococcarum]|nr:hypothetical protein MIR68_005629 [Amoeboaphelidium protococcarum]